MILKNYRMRVEYFIAISLYHWTDVMISPNIVFVSRSEPVIATPRLAVRTKGFQDRLRDLKYSRHMLAVLSRTVVGAPAGFSA